MTETRLKYLKENWELFKSFCTKNSTQVLDNIVFEEVVNYVEYLENKETWKDQEK